MQEKSVLFDNSGSGGSGAAPFATEVMATEANSGGSDSEGAEEKGKGEGGNMWPSEETVALLNVKSRMDREFREPALKELLWDEVSRKLGELGYTRSGKKCREKFEKLNEYDKRTKDGRSGWLAGKNDKFCEHLDLFDNELSASLSPSGQIQRCIIQKGNIVKPTVDQIDSASYGFIIPTPTPTPTTSSSSGRDSEGSDGKGWKMAHYFEKLMNKVLEKQESLQKQLLDTMDKCEKDRIAREEAWRMQYIERVKKEQELLANVRATAYAKDASFMELLHKVANHHEITRDTPFPKPSYNNEQNLEILTSLAANIDNQISENSLDRQDGPTEHEISLQFPNPLITESNGVVESYHQSSNTSRWPKEEVETLIRIKNKIAEDGLKGPVWDEVSSAMKRFGYDREAKRCREKWDNINKYYRRVKESHKRKQGTSGNSKTCPYFDLLDSIYKKKLAKVDNTLDLSGTNQLPEDILVQKQQQQQQQHNEHQQMGISGIIM